MTAGSSACRRARRPWSLGGTNQTGVSRGYTTGTTEHAPPGAGYGKFYNGTSWRYTAKSATVAPGGAWAVYTSGSLNFAGTYAYCITGTP